MEKIFDIVLVLLEKILIPTLIALIVAIISYKFPPKDLVFVHTLGTEWFAALSFLVSLLISLVLIKSIKFIFLVIVSELKKWIEEKDYQKKRKEYFDEQLNESLEYVWSKVDGFSENDYKLLIDFIKNQNEPIIKEESYNKGDWLLSSDWVHKTFYEQGQVYTERSKPTSPNAIGITRTRVTPDKYQYKLKKDIYKLLKYSFDKYGQISHFKKNID